MFKVGSFLDRKAVMPLAAKQSHFRTVRPRRCWLSSSASAERVVGFVGLGQMGMPMAKNLARETSVIAFDTSPAARREASQGGMQIVDSVEEVGTSHCDVLVTMLPGDAAFDHVMARWQDTCLKNTSGDNDKKQQYIINCSTVSPSTSKVWEASCRALGHVVVDAPVSGGVKGATDGTLTFMAGCDSQEDLAKVQPFLDIMGKRTIHCGKPGTGSATKLCNNLALAAQMVGVCEALNLGEKLGVDPVVLASVMNSSTAKCWSSEVNNPHPAVAASMESQPPAVRDYGDGFATNLMLKDLKLALQSASEEQLVLPLTSTTKDLYHLAQIHGLGDRDFGVLLAFFHGKHK